MFPPTLSLVLCSLLALAFSTISLFLYQLCCTHFIMNSISHSVNLMLIYIHPLSFSLFLQFICSCLISPYITLSDLFFLFFFYVFTSIQTQLSLLSVVLFLVSSSSLSFYLFVLMCFSLSALSYFFLPTFSSYSLTLEFFLYISLCISFPNSICPLLIIASLSSSNFLSIYIFVLLSL